jgi:hypothetical protein
MATTSKNAYEIRSDLLGLAKSLVEFNYQIQITHGISKPKSYWRKHKSFILMCTIPSITLIWLLSLVI